MVAILSEPGDSRRGAVGDLVQHADPHPEPVESIRLRRAPLRARLAPA